MAILLDALIGFFLDKFVRRWVLIIPFAIVAGIASSIFGAYALHLYDSSMWPAEVVAERAIVGAFYNPLVILIFVWLWRRQGRKQPSRHTVARGSEDRKAGHLDRGSLAKEPAEGGTADNGLTGSKDITAIMVVAGLIAAFAIGFLARSVINPGSESEGTGSLVEQNQSDQTATAAPSAWDQGEPTPEMRAALLAAVSSADSFPSRSDAEVWLTDMSARLARQVPDYEERMYILTRVHYEASRVDLPPELILAVIDVQSNFDRYAISVSGAIGLMQIMPFWLDEIGRPDDNLLHIDTNLRYGCTILRHYYDIENGDLGRALARFNGNPNDSEYPTRVINKLQNKWFRA